MGVLCVVLDLLKRCESANCDQEVITRIVADDQKHNTHLVTGLHRSTVSSYDFIYCNVDEALGKIYKHPKEELPRMARNSQQGARKAVRVAAGTTGGPFAGASSAIDKSLVLITKCATGKGELARPNTSSSRTANWDASADVSSSRTISDDVPLSFIMFDLRGEHYFCSGLGCVV